MSVINPKGVIVPLTRRNTRGAKWGAVAGVAAAALTSATFGVSVLAATPSFAASQTQSTTHDSFDPTGAVFTCNGGDITVTGGSADQVMHFGPDSAGVFHYTGTLTVHNITATDEAGNQYTITGADWFGGKGTEDQQLVETDTSHFVIHNATGGVYDTVSIVDHFTTNGSSFSLSFGGCQPPQD